MERLSAIRDPALTPLAVDEIANIRTRIVVAELDPARRTNVEGSTALVGQGGSEKPGWPHTGQR
jgi:hypothetical protein